MPNKRARRAAKQAAKRHPKLVATLVCILLLIVVVAVVLYFLFPEKFKNILGLDEDNTHGSQSSPVAEGTLAEITSADLSIHFIAPQVRANGDCSLIKVGDTEVLIDAGPNSGNIETINNYLATYCTDNVIEYVIATHADSDHIEGLVGDSGKENGILYTHTIGTLIQFARSDKTTNLYERYKTAVEYAKGRGTKVYNALECYNNSNGAQSTYYLDDERKISMNILYNYFYDHSSNDENNYSVCMLLSQQISAEDTNHYLFTGDLEKAGEEYLVQYNTLPEVELFKAGHHASKTSSNNCLLEVIKPKNVAVCCCAGYNQYSAKDENVFPTQAFIDRISVYTQNVYITIMDDSANRTYTPMNGDIVFYYIKSEEAIGELKLWCSNNTTPLKDTDWFKRSRVCAAWNWTDSDRSAYLASQQ